MSPTDDAQRLLGLDVDHASDDDLAAAIAAALGGRTVVAAESCTAGRVAAALASVPHAVDFFRGAVVAYQTEVKRLLLGLTGPTALSLDAARQMARGACELIDADVAIATTGVVGSAPEEGIAAGTVFVATCVDGAVAAREHHVGGEPAEMCAAAASAALRDLIGDLRAHDPARATWSIERPSPVRADAEALFVPLTDVPGAAVGDVVVLRGRDGGEERSGTIVDLCERDATAFFRVRLDT